MNGNLAWIKLTVCLLILAPAPRGHTQTAKPSSRDHGSAVGTISVVDTNQQTLTLRRFLGGRDYTLTDNCEILIGEGTRGTLADLTPGMEVEIQYLRTNDVVFARQITQRKEAWTGRIEILEIKAGDLTVTDRGFAKAMRIGDKCRYVIHGDRVGALDDLEIGQRVTVDYVKVGQKLVAVRIQQPTGSFEGALTAIDASGRTVKVKRFLSSREFTLAEDCRIVIASDPEMKLSDLTTGQSVAVDYREAGDVLIATRIHAGPPGSDPAKAGTTTPQ